MKAPVSVIVAGALALACGGSLSQAAAKDCNDIQVAYASELLQAQRCDLTAPNPCGAARPGALQDACRCPVAVNPANTAELDRLLAQFQAQTCPLEQLICNRACMAPARSCATGVGSVPKCTGP